MTPAIKAMDAMKPMIILPPNNMHSDAIKALRDNGICVVVSKNPAAVKFVDPIPTIMQRTKIEAAAIGLSRKLLSGRYANQYGNVDRKDILECYVNLLVEGTSLDPEGTQEEQMERAYDHAKADEMRKLAREDAKAEREAKREAVLKQHPPTSVQGTSKTS